LNHEAHKCKHGVMSSPEQCSLLICLKPRVLLGIEG